MSSSKGNAERNFWQVPIEYMLPFLDGESILNLSKAHSLTNMVLKNMSMSRSKMWEGLVNQIHEPWWTEERDLQVLNDILQTMGAPEALLLEFLHAICRKFASQEDPGSIWERREEVVVSCPCDISHHSVAPIGFRILESVEAALGSIAVTAVINLVEGGRRKFVYDCGVIGICPPCTRATPLVGVWPY